MIFRDTCDFQRITCDFNRITCDFSNNHIMCLIFQNIKQKNKQTNKKILVTHFQKFKNLNVNKI